MENAGKCDKSCRFEAKRGLERGAAWCAMCSGSISQETGRSRSLALRVGSRQPCRSGSMAVGDSFKLEVQDLDIFDVFDIRNNVISMHYKSNQVEIVEYLSP